ncbi:MAG: IS3 family transposase, partial [Oxalobacteraceae bacterium]
ARAKLGGYLAFFNSRRPHASLDRQTPDMVYFKTQPQVQAA